MSPAGLAVLSSGGGQAGCFWNNHCAHYRLQVSSQGSGWVCLPILGVKENVALLAASAKKKPRDGSAQRLVWAAKQPLGNAALGALFA